MGNTWSYELRVHAADFAAAVTSALDLLTAHGFAFPDPTDGIRLWRHDGDHSIAHGEVRNALTALGGTVSGLDADRDDMGLSCDPTRCELTFGVLTDLREERERDVRVERKLDALFTAAIERMSPWFARVHDEWSAEEAWLDSFVTHSDAYEHSLSAGASPSLLTWKTFVDREHRRLLDPQLFFEMPRELVTRESIAGGLLLTLGGDRPWLARAATLTDVPPRYRLVR